MADVDVIIDNAMALGSAYAQATGLLSNDAYNAAQENNLTFPSKAYVDVTNPSTGLQQAEIPITIPTSINSAEIISAYTTEATRLETLVTTTIALFLADYILDDPVYNKLLDIIAENGAIDDIATPQWNRAASRLVTDNYNAQTNVTNKIAAMNDSLPPGVLNDLLAAMALDVNIKLAELNYGATVENIKLQVSHLETALQLATDFKIKALDAAVNYIRALLTGPEIATRLVNQIYDLQSNLINAVANLYRARLERDDMFIKANVATNDLAVKWKSLEVQNIEDRVKEKVAAAVGSINAMSHIASGALSQINALASKATTF